MGPVLVVMADIAIEHSPEMLLVEDEETVGALRAHRPHRALGDGVGVGRPDRSHDAEPTGPVDSPPMGAWQLVSLHCPPWYW
jgi:hypothetical protein